MMFVVPPEIAIAIGIGNEIGIRQCKICFLRHGQLEFDYDTDPDPDTDPDIDIDLYLYAGHLPQAPTKIGEGPFFAAPACRR